MRASPPRRKNDGVYVGDLVLDFAAALPFPRFFAPLAAAARRAPASPSAAQLIGILM